MNENRGKDPNAMINSIVSSGQISQAQLDSVQRMAGQIAGTLDGLKSTFGF